MQGEKKAFAESQRRLLELDKDAAMREELLPKEEEHTKLQARLLALEGLRDKHSEMQARQKEEAVREQAIVANLSRTKKLIDDLHKAQCQARGDCILPGGRKEVQERAGGACPAKRAAKGAGRTAGTKECSWKSVWPGCRSEAAKARAEMESLQSIEEKEALLRRQDKDLDQLVSELNRVLADLRGSYKVEELALAEAERSIKKVMALGAEGLCPTCERPLGGPARSAHQEV